VFAPAGATERAPTRRDDDVSCHRSVVEHVFVLPRVVGALTVLVASRCRKTDGART
jgi:hypothetical protein